MWIWLPCLFLSRTHMSLAGFCLSVVWTGGLNLGQLKEPQVFLIQHRAPRTPKRTHTPSSSITTSNKELPHHILLLWNHTHSLLTTQTHTVVAWLHRKMETWKARGGAMKKKRARFPFKSCISENLDRHSLWFSFCFLLLFFFTNPSALAWRLDLALVSYTIACVHIFLLKANLSGEVSVPNLHKWLCKSDNGENTTVNNFPYCDCIIDSLKCQTVRPKHVLL